MVDRVTGGRGATESVLGAEQRFDDYTGGQEALDVVHSFSIDPGVIADQADAAPGNQVEAVGQEHVDPGPHIGPDGFELTIGRAATTGCRDDQP